MGCAAGILVTICLEGMQLEHLTLTGRPEARSDSSSATGTTKISGVVAKEPETRLVRAECVRRKHEHGCNNEEDVVGNDATVLWSEAWAGYGGGFFERR